jgi:uncharacterized membrane protein (UPF0127 family)
VGKLAAAAALLSILIVSSCQTQEEILYPLSLGAETLYVEIADTAAERQEGLMYRRTLEADRGMLFIFESSRMLSFWMRNTYIDLSIAYIADDGTIIDILDMYALDETSVPSSAPARFALEVNKGTFDRLGVYPGDRIDLSGIPGTD